MYIDGIQSAGDPQYATPGEFLTIFDLEPFCPLIFLSEAYPTLGSLMYYGMHWKIMSIFQLLLCFSLLSTLGLEVTETFIIAPLQKEL